MDKHPPDQPLRCINCKKDHPANYINCNRCRCLLGLNPLPDTPDPQSTGRKPKRTTGRKQGQKKKQTPKESTNHNNVEGLEGNQLLKAFNAEDMDMPIKLQVSSVMHEKAQAQVNRSSQRL